MAGDSLGLAGLKLGKQGASANRKVELRQLLSPNRRNSPEYLLCTEHERKTETQIANTLYALFDALLLLRSDAATWQVG